MDRRTFSQQLLTTTAITAPLIISSGSAVAASITKTPPAHPFGGTASRQAYRELLDLLDQLDSDWITEKGRIRTPWDVPDAYRFMMHILENGIFNYFESNADWPVFKKMVSPSRKYLGDNPDAIYHDCVIRPDRRYRITGNTAGAVYVSVSIEGRADSGEEGVSGGIVAAMNDTEFDIAVDGSFEITLGPDCKGRNCLALPSNSATISMRHYFEEQSRVAGDPRRHVPIYIEPLDNPAPPATWDDESVGAGIRRVTNQLRSKVANLQVTGQGDVPEWVSKIPNQFSEPGDPGTIAYTAVDNVYTMAPYVLKEDEALVMTGRFPKCRFSNVALWNFFLQTYDYAHRPTSLNRKQTVLEKDGSYRMVIAHKDPGVNNWIDTEGRGIGFIYWRFLLPEEPPMRPKTEVVKFSSL